MCVCAFVRMCVRVCVCVCVLCVCVVCVLCVCVVCLCVVCVLCVGVRLCVCVVCVCMFIRGSKLFVLHQISFVSFTFCFCCVFLSFRLQKTRSFFAVQIMGQKF